MYYCHGKPPAVTYLLPAEADILQPLIGQRDKGLGGDQAKFYGVLIICLPGGLQ